MDHIDDVALTAQTMILGSGELLPGRLHVDSPDACWWLARSLSACLGRLPEGQPPALAIVCIGTDRSTGDSLGPIVGSKLREWRFLEKYAAVLGTLDDPVHAGNLGETIGLLEHRERDGCHILAVDACLGKLGSVGYITFADGPLRPGTGVNKDLPHIGTAHITGVVNVGGFMEYLVLQNTRLSLVMRMADAIARGIIAYISDSLVR